MNANDLVLTWIHLKVYTNRKGRWIPHGIRENMQRGIKWRVFGTCVYTSAHQGFLSSSRMWMMHDMILLNTTCIIFVWCDVHILLCEHSFVNELAKSKEYVFFSKKEVIWIKCKFKSPTSCVSVENWNVGAWRNEWILKVWPYTYFCVIAYRVLTLLSSRSLMTPI